MTSVDVRKRAYFRELLRGCLLERREKAATHVCYL